MKLGAIVILYNPELDEAVSNIDKYIHNIDLLIVWDNTPGGTKNIEKIFQYKNIIIQGTGKNEGISKALNQSFRELEKKGYDYVLTMDQDSIWEDFKKYKSNIERNLKKKYGVFAPQIKANGIVLRVNNTMNVITSGSVISMNAYKEIGGFNENLFIDEVDNEFCFRLIRNNYKIKLFQSIYLNQIFGSPKDKGFINKYTSNYSAFRTYHQIRNRIWVWKEYKDIISVKYILRTLWVQIIRRTFIILLVEDSKKSKLLAIIRGIKDGISKRL